MSPSFTPCEYARQMQTARRQANTLRDQTIADFWQRAGVALRTTWRAASRPALRLTGHGQPGKKQGA